MGDPATVEDPQKFARVIASGPNGPFRVDTDPIGVAPLPEISEDPPPRQLAVGLNPE